MSHCPLGASVFWGVFLILAPAPQPVFTLGAQIVHCKVNKELIQIQLYGVM